jgi:hypothetical protein
MPHLQREVALRQERGKGLVRTLHRHELEEAGRLRRQSEDEADRQLERIASHLPGALAAGLSLTEISRVTGVSRPTLYELQKGEAGWARDLAFEALSALASTGPLVFGRLGELLELDDRRLRGVVNALAGEALIESVGVGDRGARVFAITTRGEERLSAWEFRGTEQDITVPFRVALRAFGYSEAELQEIDHKVAVALASGKSRLGLLEALRMGMAKEIDSVLGSATRKARRAGKDASR